MASRRFGIKIGKNSEKNRPKVIARVPVVLLGGERRHTGEASQHQQARVGRQHRGQTRQHTALFSNAASFGKASQALAVVASASASVLIPRSSATVCAMRGSSPGSLRPCG